MKGSPVRVRASAFRYLQVLLLARGLRFRTPSRAKRPPAVHQRKVVDQLIVDKEQYRQHGDCKTLVCFIYDPDHRLTNLDTLEADLSSDEAGLVTHVVVAPQPS